MLQAGIIFGGVCLTLHKKIEIDVTWYEYVGDIWPWRLTLKITVVFFKFRLYGLT